MEEKLFDPVAVDILERIVEKRKCTEEELRESPEVIKESQRIIDDLERNGLIEVEQETVNLTEKARLLLKTFDELGSILEEGGVTMEDKEDDQEEYFHELFNFCCILRGEVKYLEEIKEYIITEYVRMEKVKLIKPTYDKTELYILTDAQWKEYQTLKEKDRKLIESLG
jgi:predicted transcriptional regulator